MVPCLYEGKPVNYTVQMFLNDGTARRQRCLVEGDWAGLLTTINSLITALPPHRAADRVRPRDLGIPQEVRRSRAPRREGHTHRYARRTRQRHDTHTTRHTEE